MLETYIPEKGDIVRLDFDPILGREQGGDRPALVLSPLEYNAKTSLCVVCPITSKAKGYSFEVTVSPDTGVSVVILVDRIKSQEWRKRHVKKIAKLSDADLKFVQGILANFLVNEK